MYGGCGNWVYIYVTKQHRFLNEGFQGDKLISCILQLCFIENVELSEKEGDCLKKKEVDVGKMYRKEGELLPKAGELTPQCSQDTHPVS